VRCIEFPIKKEIESDRILLDKTPSGGR